MRGLEETWVRWDHQELRVQLVQREQMVHQDSRDLLDRSDCLGSLVNLVL